VEYADATKTHVTPTHLTPPQTILASYALMIFVGTLLLVLPASGKSGESAGLLNALFTATSANCVSGLVVLNTMEHWSWFGKIVILLLSQFGALGFITVMVVPMLLMRRQITLRNRRVIQAFFNQNEIGGMVKLTKSVVFVTILFESIGAVLLAIIFYAYTPMTLWESTYQGVFHSISAFCNAGFDNIGANGLIQFQTNIPINFILISLIVAGGLGFTVWNEIIHGIKNTQKRSLRFRIIHFSLHTKIALVVTGVLIFSGAAFVLLLEWSNPKTLGDLAVWQKFQAALFQSVALRTAGFNTIAQNGLTEVTKFISCIFMLIGGASAGTAGGMKTVTVGVIFFSILSVLKGRNRLEAFGRTLPLDLLQKALMVVSMMLTVVFVCALLLHFTEQSNPFPHTFWDLLFESCSAAGSTGISMGITPHLSTAGKVIIIICMYLGRLSPVMIVMALYAKLHASVDSLSFPEERVIIG